MANRYLEKLAQYVPERAESSLRDLISEYEEEWDEDRRDYIYLKKDPLTARELVRGYGSSLAQAYPDSSATAASRGKKGFLTGAGIGLVGGALAGAAAPGNVGEKAMLSLMGGIGAGVPLGILGGAVGAISGAPADMRRAKERSFKHRAELEGMTREQILDHINEKIRTLSNTY